MAGTDTENEVMASNYPDDDSNAAANESGSKKEIGAFSEMEILRGIQRIFGENLLLATKPTVIANSEGRLYHKMRFQDGSVRAVPEDGLLALLNEDPITVAAFPHIPNPKHLLNLTDFSEESPTDKTVDSVDSDKDTEKTEETDSDDEETEETDQSKV